MASRMAAVGRVTVSLLKSIFMERLLVEAETGHAANHPLWLMGATPNVYLPGLTVWQSSIGNKMDLKSGYPFWTVKMDY
ncbi:hypothetical protein HAALTHF_50730n [Vreelandella aquamarina]|nr:hypothetical protein HAALTHF_50730n [Halomonas axialensis]